MQENLAGKTFERPRSRETGFVNSAVILSVLVDIHSLIRHTLKKVK